MQTETPALQAASLDTMRHSGPYLPFLSSIETTYLADATLTVFETPAYDVFAVLIGIAIFRVRPMDDMADYVLEGGGRWAPLLRL